MAESDIDRIEKLVGYPPNQELPLEFIDLSDQLVPEGSPGELERLRSANRLLISENERLRQLIDDEVTGLPQRREFAVDLQHVHGRFVRDHDNGYAIGFWDLDHLKIVNDNHGHENGDRYLRATATAITNVLRKGDKLYRVGGDEFCAIILGGFTLDLVEVFDNRVEDSISETLDPLQEEFGLPLSVSFGYSFVKPGDEATDVARRADEMMYAQKRATKGLTERQQRRSLRLPLLGGVAGTVYVVHEPRSKDN